MGNVKPGITFPKWRPSFKTRILLDEGKGLFYGKKSRFYKALRNSSTGFINRPTVRNYILNRDGNKCKNCGSIDNLTIDHIKSVLACSEGLILIEELNVENNLQTLCKSCNSSKKHFNGETK